MPFLHFEWEFYRKLKNTQRQHISGLHIYNTFTTHLYVSSTSDSWNNDSDCQTSVKQRRNRSGSCLQSILMQLSLLV